MRWKSTTIALAVLVGLVGCHAETKLETKPPNILLISIDALRADALHCYGNPRPTSPFLDHLAAEGIRFADASVATHGTPTSHTTMLSGLYQETHRVSYAIGYQQWPTDQIPAKVVFVSQIFQKHGYRTIGVTGGGNVGGELGFSRGFDEFDDSGGGVKPVTRKMIELIEKGKSDHRPIFMFLHTYEVHSPYEPPAPYKGMFGKFDSTFDPTNENLIPHANDALTTLTTADLELARAQYDEELRYTDDVLRDFFAQLRKLGLFDNMLVVFTGDHGEEFGEHGGLIHRDHLYQELLHVPLIAYGTGSASLPKGVVEHALVSEVSIAPSLLSMAGIPPPDTMEGRVILPKVTGRKDGPIFAQYGARRYMIREGQYKLIENADPFHLLLYDLKADPHELHDVAAEHDSLVQRLYLELRKWKAERHPVGGAAPPVHLSKEEIERLKALGYLGGQ